MNPPIAPKKPQLLTTHGDTRLDNYYWLREKTDKEVLTHLAAENSYTEAKLAHTKPLQKTLYDEMVGRIQETDSTAPVKHGDYVYYSRTEAGKEYSIYCRQSVGSSDEEVLLDLNVLAEEYDFLRLGVYKMSPNHKLLAYSLDTTGGEKYTVYVKNLETGVLLADQIPNTGYALEWTNDNKTLYYTTHDAAWRSHQLHRYVLGSGSSNDEVLHHEPDALFNVRLSKTRDSAYIVLGIHSIETSEVWVASAADETAVFQTIHPRQHKHRYSLAHHSGTFYIQSNEDAPNYKVMTVAASDPAKANWQELIPHRTAVKIDGMALFADHLVLYQRENGLKTIQVRQLASGESHEVAFVEPVYSYLQAENPEFETATLRFTYRSLTTPDTVIDYDMNGRSQTIVKRKAVGGGYDPAVYETKRIWATADDGTQIPISLLYRKGMGQSGDNLTLLYGYGSYGVSQDPSFDANRLSLVDRGFIFALAHIRGGGEMGRHWYEQGKFLQKKNTFTDFVACARHLIAANYTQPAKLSMMGRSAGGLLMGAVLNLAPELFHAAIAGVPFVDVITTMLDESIPLTVGEFEEWGNPKDKTYYNYMLSYSPYDNVAAKQYPHILATAGLNDPRVQYWEPAKWVAKLRTVKIDSNDLLFKINMGAGHFSASGRYAYLEDVALQYAFLLDRFGIRE
ncbi:MAG: S9 family peptidase [Chloroflexota bacterium]